MNIFINYITLKHCNNGYFPKLNDKFFQLTNYFLDQHIDLELMYQS
jgi:hypothetical protein